MSKMKICPFIKDICDQDYFPCAMYDEKRQCCGMIQPPQRFLITEGGKQIIPIPARIAEDQKEDGP